MEGEQHIVQQQNTVDKKHFFIGRVWFPSLLDEMSILCWNC
jgi:hypothetical protein